MARSVFKVSPQEDGWVVLSDERVMERHANRSGAVEAGVRWARAHRPSVLLVTDVRGLVEHWQRCDPDSCCPTGPAPAIGNRRRWTSSGADARSGVSSPR